MIMDERVLARIPKDLHRAIADCWLDSTGSVWIILWPGWAGYNGRCIHAEDLASVPKYAKMIHEVPIRQQTAAT